MTICSGAPVAFGDSVRALLDGKEFAGVATLGPGGAPQNSVVWIKREGDTAYQSAEIVPDEGKRLPRELSRKYLGVDSPAEKDNEVRVIIKVVPRKVVAFSA
ncbi:PPOX class F420-dependent oxidoreductase [Streptomyces sp. NPDC001450]